MEEELISHSVRETMQIAQEFAQTCKPGDIIRLEGELGAGKTHFVKGFVTAFGLDSEQVTSPTFVLIHEYQHVFPVYHFDFYRLDNVEQALEIGVEEYLYGEGVCIIEWPEKIESLLPDGAVRITLKMTGPHTRAIRILRKTDV